MSTRPEGFLDLYKILLGNCRRYDATKMEMDQIKEYQIFKVHGKAKYDPKSKRIINAPHWVQSCHPYNHSLHHVH